VNILGVSALYHDSAAVLIQDGNIIAAAQEERFTRVKHDSNFPTNAIEYCLGEAGISANELESVVFYDKPFLKFERLLETYLSFAPFGFSSFKKAIPVWIREKLFQKDLLIKELKKFDKAVDWQNRVLFSEHHLSHAASAFYPSPFEEAIVLTMDGVGEWATTSVCHGKGKDLKILKEIHFPHSLGLLYSAFTYYTGFRVNSGEYKLMGLAPYGDPKYTDLILDKIVDIKEDGSFRLDQSYFNYCTGLTMTNDKFHKLFGQPPRRADVDELTPFHMDIAASIQQVTEKIISKITISLAKETGVKNICLAGGVALNCVANGKILREKAFENIWVQPASGDAGGALGAALAVYHLMKGGERHVTPGKDQIQGSYLGPSFKMPEIERQLTEAGAKYHVLSNDELFDRTAQALQDSMAIGWFQGRMEFGPRSLGGRSILGDPRSESMQKTLNLKVKFRESFRPFAPSVLEEEASKWFDLGEDDSPYMLMVADVHEDKKKIMTPEQEALFGIEKLNVVRSEIPAVTHVDYSARVQTVSKETNPRYHRLISEFNQKSGCPVVVNTSFNVRGEPIVCQPSDAFRCFMGTGIEVLVVENCFLLKSEQSEELALEYKDMFKLD